MELSSEAPFPPPDRDDHVDEALDVEHTAATPAAPSPVTEDRLDLDRIERELHGVETALARLDDGSYWVDADDDGDRDDGDLDTDW